MRGIENKINVLIVLEVIESIAIALLVLVVILFIGLIIHKMALEKMHIKCRQLEKVYKDELDEIKAGGNIASTVNVNTATQSELEGIKGIGVVKAKIIIAARLDGGYFQGSIDLQKRVSGIGIKSLEKMLNNGLSIDSPTPLHEPKYSRAITKPLNHTERKVLAKALSKFRNKKKLLDPLILKEVENVELLPSLKNDYKSKNIGRKIVSVQSLGLLGIYDLRDFYLTTANSTKNTRIYATCMRAFAKVINNKDDLFLLANILDKGPSISGSFNESMFLEAFESLADNRTPQAVSQIAEELIESFDSGNFIVLDIISACGRSGVIYFAPILEGIYENSPDKVGFRIACIRGLGNLEVRSDCIIHALEDKSWPVRAVASKCVHIFGSSVVPSLVKLLVDESFYVRENAAISLTTIGGAGVQALRDADKSDDRFKREIAHYALAVKAVHD